MEPIRFDNQVAIVTGAGGGLGREYAHALARRGAKVVVNDIGTSRDGRGLSDAAVKVAEEIEAFGGVAIPDSADVTDYEQVARMVSDAKARWDGVHILINNAGVLRDKSFANMTPQDFEFVVRVHLLGSAFTTKACWNTMRDQKFGRVLMTTSSSGLFGNFGQANYAAAKMGLVGLAKTLAIEGAKYDIRVNSISPIAATRMTEDLLSASTFAAYAPERVTPAALFLLAKDAPSGATVGAGGGVFQSSYVTLTRGVMLVGNDLSAEGVSRSWDEIADPANQAIPHSGNEHSEIVSRQLEDSHV